MTRNRANASVRQAAARPKRRLQAVPAERPRRPVSARAPLTGRGPARRLRASAEIPPVIYGKSGVRHMTVKEPDFRMLMRAVAGTAALVEISDSKGATTWVQTFGDKDHDQGRAIALDDKGDAYVSGLYRFALSLLDPPVKQVIDAMTPESSFTSAASLRRRISERNCASSRSRSACAGSFGSSFSSISGVMNRS